MHVLSESSPLSSASLIYQQFMLSLVQQQQVMGLINPQQQWAWCGTHDHASLALWHHPSLIKPVIGHWPGYRIFPVSLQELIDHIIPVLIREKKALALNLAADGQHVSITPQHFMTDLKNYLYELQRAQPNVYQALKLPQPRRIRLHA